MRCLLILCLLASTATAARIHGLVTRGGKTETFEIHLSIDAEPFQTIAPRYSVDVTKGQHFVTFAGPGFVTHDEWVTVGDDTTCNIDVERGAHLTGQVVDEMTEPVAHASVLAYTWPAATSDSQAHLWHSAAQLVTTNDRGEFAIDGIGSGIPKIVAFTATQRSPIQMWPEPDRAVKLTIAASGSITGEVAHAVVARSPMVTVTSITGIAVADLARIDDRGHFTVDVPAGDYDVALDDELMAPARVTVTAAHTSTVKLTVPTQRGSLDVHAKGCDLIELDGARPGELAAHVKIDTATCDADRVTFDDLPYGMYRVCTPGACREVRLKGRSAVELRSPSTPRSSAASNPGSAPR
ncbi:MAG: hypothetical protein QM831_05635 [Kofleriaceae bacterium]